MEMRTSSGYPEVPLFVRTLVEQAAAESRKRSRTRTQDEFVRSRAADLRNLHIENVGVFEKLELDFPTNWTLLLGANGCGKSTVLKAIGLALCGAEPRADAAAQRLLRREKNVKVGLIKLFIGGEELRVELIRGRDSVRLVGPPTTPVMARTVLAIGAPALRGVTTRAPSGYQQMDRVDPSVDDLLPLVRGPYDGRLDTFMQWALNAKLAADRDRNGPDAAMVRTLEKLRARTRIFESRNGEGIPSVTQRE